MSLAVEGDKNKPMRVAISPRLRRRKRQRASHYNIQDLGALGDGVFDSTFAIQAAVDRCARNGGGTVYVPAGDYVTGALRMRSNLTLHLDAGATLIGSDSITAFPVSTTRWEGPDARPMHAGIINGEDLTNVAIVGRGTIDGNGAVWWERYRSGKLDHERGKLIRLVNCRDILIDGITLCNSPMWTLNPVACDNVTISRITIRNASHSPNTDGINPDSCSNVRISDCHIDVGDDCIAIKAGTEDDGRMNRKTCENIVVSGCTMLRGHGGVVIGSEITGGVRNVSIGNCVFRGTDRGIRIKARRGRGSAVEDISVSNIVMDEVLCPIVVNLFYGCGATDLRAVSDTEPHPVTSATPSFRRLRFSQITARRVKYAAAYILGLPEMFVEDVVLDNLSICMDENNAEPGQPAMSPLAPDLCRAGMRIRNARDVKMRGIDIRGHVGPAVLLESTSDITLSDLSDGVRKVVDVQSNAGSNIRSDEGVNVIECPAPSPGVPGEGSRSLRTRR